jgi:hypothetical protein
MFKGLYMLSTVFVFKLTSNNLTAQSFLKKAYFSFYERKLVIKMKSSLRKFNDRHHGLVNRCRISVSQMATDMFWL